MDEREIKPYKRQTEMDEREEKNVQYTKRNGRERRISIHTKDRQIGTKEKIKSYKRRTAMDESGQDQAIQKTNRNGRGRAEDQAIQKTEKEME